MANRFITCLIISVLSANVFGQANVKEADNLLYTGSFEDALEMYLEVLEEEPENIALHYKVAVCYLNTNVDKTLSVKYLERFIAEGEFDNNANYLLGRAYSYSGEFDKAEKKGFRRNSGSMQWLKENEVLFGKANWFMLDPQSKSKGFIKPSSSCYNWVNDKLIKQPGW